MQVQRVQQHIIRKSNINFKMLDEMCFNSKNLYNSTLYILRQAYTGNAENIKEFKDLIKNEKYIDEYDLTLRMSKVKHPDFCSLDKVQSAQQVVKLVYKNMKSFYKALKEYSKNKSKFLGRPKLPKYKDKNGRNIVVFTNQASAIKHGEIYFTKFKKLRGIKTDIDKFQQIRIIHKGYYIVVEIIYLKEVDENKNKSFANSIGIDIGVDNLASITSDNGLSLIVNGRSLKSINQYFNKENAKLKSIYDKQGIKTGRRLQSLNLKRNNKIKDYIHKASRFIVNLCLKNKVKTVFIGHNKEWKQNSNIGKKNNQNFIQIPFSLFIQMLKYKLNEENISLVELNEAYTSKCSFLDNEEICKHDSYLGRRIKRGLFKSSSGKVLNADINGSLNILKRGLDYNFNVFKSFFNPVKINIIKESIDVRNDQIVEAVCCS